VTLLVVGVFIFGSVWFLSKKVTELNFFKKNQNWFKPTGFDSVRLCFLEQKPVQTGFGSVRLVFFWFGSIFLIWLGCLPVFSVQVWFDSDFSVPGLKNQNRTG